MNSGEFRMGTSPRSSTTCACIHFPWLYAFMKTCRTERSQFTLVDAIQPASRAFDTNADVCTEIGPSLMATACTRDAAAASVCIHTVSSMPYAACACAGVFRVSPTLWLSGWRQQCCLHCTALSWMGCIYEYIALCTLEPDATDSDGKR